MEAAVASAMRSPLPRTLTAGAKMAPIGISEAIVVAVRRSSTAATLVTLAISSGRVMRMVASGGGTRECIMHMTRSGVCHAIDTGTTPKIAANVSLSATFALATRTAPRMLLVLPRHGFDLRAPRR